jgi:hypothetical protein
VRLWPRKPRQEDQRVEKPPAPKRPQSGEELREAFLKKLESRPDDKES